MSTVVLEIEGMSCGHCVARVRKTLEQLPSVRVEDVQVGSARVEVGGAGEVLARVLAALTDAGYPARASMAP